MAYNSSHTGAQIDSAVGAVIEKEATWDSKQDGLRGKKGQLVGFTADNVPGAVDAPSGGVNPNLLDNWYFGNPVNQRGLTELASGNWDKYFIDRWRATSSDCAYAITEDGVKISNLPHQYSQIFLQNLESVEKRPYTLSFLLKDVGLLSATFTPEGSDYKDFYLGGFVISFLSKENLANPSVRILDSADSTVSSVTILAAKLELGDTQTLAHKENGVWVLNEIPDFGEQLRRCQRYCVAFKQYDTFFQADTTDFIVELPCPMRTLPTIINPENITNVTNPTVARYNVGSNQLRLRSTATYNNATAVCSGLVLFSADL